MPEKDSVNNERKWQVLFRWHNNELYYYPVCYSCKKVHTPAGRGRLVFTDI